MNHRRRRSGSNPEASAFRKTRDVPDFVNGSNFTDEYIFFHGTSSVFGCTCRTQNKFLLDGVYRVTLTSERSFFGFFENSKMAEMSSNSFK